MHSLQTNHKLFNNPLIKIISHSFLHLRYLKEYLVQSRYSSRKYLLYYIELNAPIFEFLQVTMKMPSVEWYSKFSVELWCINDPELYFSFL